VQDGLDIGFRLDERWHLLRGERMDSKRDDLLLLARLLEDAGVPWALIGGLAYQVHAQEPRATLDIDVAIPARDGLPREALEAAGFRRTGSHRFSDNWVAPAGSPVQFADDPPLVEALRTARPVRQAGVSVRVIGKLEFVQSKLRAAADPGRRRTKALRDLADLETILEESPGLDARLDDGDRALLAAARRRAAGG